MLTTKTQSSDNKVDTKLYPCKDMTNEALIPFRKVRLYNTLTRKVEDFIPLKGNEVGLYTCGPTVYNYAHIGNLRTYIFEDILKNVLTTKGYNVKHVMNVTDVGHLVSDADVGEDKMELGAKRENKNAWDIADYYFKAFRNDLAKLGVKAPDIWCKATEHILEQIEFVRKLEEKGFVYLLEDGVYFDTSKVEDYGKLAKLDVEGLQAGARVEMAQGKRNITDFALWKFSPKDKQRQMEWDSPWGIGFPGWHIECSAMALKYLGEQFDIHCGGIDHIPVHHTNEIAQTESLTGKTWVNRWMHGEFLVLDKNEKMAKSGNNFITIDTLVQNGINPLAYRYFCLNAHYRKPLLFSWDGIRAADNALKKLESRVVEFKETVSTYGNGNISGGYMDRFSEAVENDLNIPLGLAYVWDLVNDSQVTQNDKYITLLEMDKVLGLGFENMKAKEMNISEEIMKLVNDRNTARRNKDFATADRIRSKLDSMGYILDDTPKGTKVRVK